MNIREIRACDYPGVLPLWNHELGNRWATAENLAATYAQMQANDAYQTYVAVAGDGAVAGLITMVVVLAVGFPAGYLKINGLAVAEAYRGQGVGKALLQRAEAFARERGITSVGLATGFQRKEAHAFYEHLGYESGSYWYGKTLS